MNYLLWLEDTLNINKITDVTGILYPGHLFLQYVEIVNEAWFFSGLDIGTGGGIYFCAIAAKHFKWKMVGTEANQSDFAVAQTNVIKNNLESTVKVFYNKNDKEI